MGIGYGRRSALEQADAEFGNDHRLAMSQVEKIELGTELIAGTSG